MTQDKNGRELKIGDQVTVEYTVTNITDDYDDPNEKRLTLALTDPAIPFAERVVVGCWMKPANVVKVGGEREADTAEADDFSSPPLAR